MKTTLKLAFSDKLDAEWNFLNQICGKHCFIFVQKWRNCNNESAYCTKKKTGKTGE